MYFKSIGLSPHDLRRHGSDGAESGLLQLIILNLFGKAHICYLIDSIMGENVFGLEIAMDDLMTVEFLNTLMLTAIPLMICLSTSMASFYGILNFLSIYS